MYTFRRYMSNFKRLPREHTPLPRVKQKENTSSKIVLGEGDKELRALMEKRLFAALPESWNSSKIINLQKFVSGTFLTLLLGGGAAANYYDENKKDLSRSIISSEIHLLSSYLAFIVSSFRLHTYQSGLQSGLQHYLGCGIVQKRFNWIPHYRQGVAISGVLAASFASANSDVASRTVLYFLLLSYLGVLGNEYLFAKLKLAPIWMKYHSPRKAFGVFIGIPLLSHFFVGILLLLMCESQTLPGKTPEL